MEDLPQIDDLLPQKKRSFPEKVVLFENWYIDDIIGYIIIYMDGIYRDVEKIVVFSSLEEWDELKDECKKRNKSFEIVKRRPDVYMNNMLNEIDAEKQRNKRLLIFDHNTMYTKSALRMCTLSRINKTEIVIASRYEMEDIGGDIAQQVDVIFRE